MVDFEIPEHVKARRGRVATFINTRVMPVERQIHTHDLPLVAWLAEARANRIVDGPDEIHRWTVGRNVIRAFERDGTTAAAAGGELF